MRVVAIGDIGVMDNMIHIGDEAMFEQFVDRMRTRGVDEVVGLSAAADDTARRYGVQALPQVGFDPRTGREAMAQRLRRVTGTAAGQAGLLAPDDPARGVIEAVSAADAVAVTGGGNLTSTWPANIAERVAVAGIARVLGRPLVVTGQTIGPDLVAHDREAVASLLVGARLVGVRERPSFDLARALGVPTDRLAQNVDDAAFFDSPTTAERPVVAVSLSTHVGDVDREAFARAVATLLDAVCAHTGLGVVFVPHFASFDPADRRGDCALHDAVHALMSTPDTAHVTHLTPSDSRTAAAASRGAALVVTSRYHPAVFATSAGVPTLGVAVDAYTSVKLTGATAAFGQSGVVAVEDLLSGAAITTALALWEDRQAVRERGLAAAAEQRPRSQAWWDRVAEALSGGRPIAGPPPRR